MQLYEKKARAHTTKKKVVPKNAVDTVNYSYKSAVMFLMNWNTAKVILEEKKLLM